MATLIDLAADLTGQVPGLPNLFARKYVNTAIKEVRKDYLWSWNIGEGILIIPDGISNGTVSLTQYSPTITFDATAQAALNPVAPSLTAALTSRQFRVPGGPIYNLVAYDTTTGIGTLDRIYTEATSPGSSYLVYKVYYGPCSSDGVTPNNDFLRYMVLLNPINGYAISGKRLYMTRTTINRRDPLRGAIGLPYYMASYQPNAAGFMTYEMWPGCITNLALMCNYEKIHVDLGVNDSLPAQLPGPLVIYRALEYAYRWAMQNAGRLPELKGVDWRFALADAQRSYAKELVGAKRNDKEILLNIYRPGSGYVYDFEGPIDSNFYQSHGLPML
jgi:hypothetical protein